MQSPQIFYYKNDNLIELTGLKDEATDTFVNDATVTAVMKSAAGAQIAGQSWPLTLSYIGSSDGVYRGILDAAAEVAIGDSVTIEITIAASAGRDAFFAITAKVRQRGKVYY